MDIMQFYFYDNTSTYQCAVSIKAIQGFFKASVHKAKAMAFNAKAKAAASKAKAGNLWPQAKAKA